MYTQGKDAFPPMGFFRLAAALFAYPRLALLNVRLHKSWGICLVWVLIVTAIAAMVKTNQIMPMAREQSQLISDLTTSTLKDITYDTEKDQFGWTAKLQLPLTKTSGDWQLDVLEKQEDFNASKAKDGGRQGGIALAKDDVSIWLRDSTASTGIVLNKVPRQSLIDLFRQNGKVRDSKFILTAESIQTINSLVPPLVSVALGIATAFFNLKLLFTCVIIFVIMTTLFNRGEKASWGTVVASSLACTLPPYVLALAFSLIPRLPLDMDTYFTLFFVIYLIVIFLDRSVLIKRLK